MNVITRISKINNFNLCSLKSVPETYEGKTYLAFLIATIHLKTGGPLYAELHRRNYDVRPLLEQLDKFSDHIFDLTKDNETAIFSIKAGHMSDALLYLLSELWFAFEHSSFCFFESGIPAPKSIYRKGWSDITSQSTSYVMFRGAELDVVWIGKSDELAFDFIENMVVV